MVNNDMAAAHRAIRVWLAERGKTQEWLAKKARLSPATISRVLTGSLPPSPMVVARVERLTGINIQKVA